jgi:hypothetical protein
VATGRSVSIGAIVDGIGIVVAISPVAAGRMVVGGRATPRGTVGSSVNVPVRLNVRDLVTLAEGVMLDESEKSKDESQDAVALKSMEFVRFEETAKR